MTRLLIATTNRNKVREIREVMSDVAVELITLADLPAVPEAEESGVTFQENARIKAFHYARLATPFLAGQPVLTVAEDSGLVIDILGGEPGVLSARYLRPDASYEERFADIYRRLREHPDRPRSARFICALAAVAGGAVVFETTGTVEGEITEPPRGSAGFGYDPIFYYPPYGRTLAEVDESRKLAVAHRGHAFRKLSDWLRTGATPEARPEF